MTSCDKDSVEISHRTEGYIAMTMDKTTKDISEENKNQVPVVSKQSGTKVEPAQSNALVVYEKQEIARKKRGSSGNRDESRHRLTDNLCSYF